MNVAIYIVALSGLKIDDVHLGLDKTLKEIAQKFCLLSVVWKKLINVHIADIQ